MNLSARKGRHVDLRFHTRRHYLRGLDNLRGQQSILDQEHVRVETRPLMPRSNLSDDAGKVYLAQVRQGALGYDYVVELQELPRRKTHPIGERCRILRAENSANRNAVRSALRFVSHDPDLPL